jgi:spore germination cell wall hydrolase CwlJ-like protein
MKMIKTLFWLTLTVYHEARGESVEGQKAVVKVILNRSKKKGWPIEDIVRARKQFSCFNNGLKDPAVWIKNVEALLPVMENCQAGYNEWMAGDHLQGATHYFAIKGMICGKPPYWADSMKFVCEIQGHKFYREG